MTSDKLRHAFNTYRSRGMGAMVALKCARSDVSTGKPHYTSSPWRRFSGMNAGGGAADSVRWIENPAHAGLRFVDYCDKLARIDHTGWFTDPEGFGKMRGVVYQLPGRNGVARFVAAYDNEDNGAAECGGPARVDFGRIHETEARGFPWRRGEDCQAARDAAYAADSLAEHEAEREREYQTAWRAGSDWAQDKEDATTIRRDILETLAARRKVRSELLAAGLSLASREWARACATFRESVDTRLEALREVRQRMAELASGDHGELIFYPSETLRGAFNDGAGEAVI